MESDSNDQLLSTISTLRIAIPASLLTIVLVSWLAHAFLALMDSVQAQGWSPIDGQEEPWTVDDPVVPVVEGEGGVDEPTPVVVRVKKVRRGLVLASIGVIAFTYFGDGIAQVIATILTSTFTPDSPIFKNIIFYSVGSLAAFGLCGIGMLWEEKKAGESAAWGFWYPKVLTVVAWSEELAMLVLLVQIIAHDKSTQPKETPLPAVHVGILSFRLLLLTLLLLSQTPLFQSSSFVPYASLHPGSAAESTSLLANGNVLTTYGTAANSKLKSMLRSSKPISNRPPDPKSLSILTLFTRVKILFPYLWPSKSFGLQVLAIICFGLMLLKRFLNVAYPIFFGRVVGDLAEGRPPYLNIGLYVLVSFLQDSNSMLYQFLWLPIQQYTEREMTMMGFDAVLNLSLAYHTKRKTGELMRILDRSEAINDFFETLIFTFIPVLIDLPVAVVVLWVRYGLLIVAIVSIVSILFVGTSVMLAESRTKLSRKLRDASQHVRQIQTDTLFNWETTKIFTAEQFESERLGEAMRVYQKGWYKVYSAWNSLALIQNSISSFGLLVCALILARRVVDGEIDVGNFVTFISYLGQLYSPLRTVTSLYRRVMSNLVDTEQLMDLLKEPKDIVDVQNAPELVVKGGAIKFDSVHFSYDGKRETIKGISFEVKPGHSAALVGPSGGGKSTIMRLLYRFYQPAEGSIEIDGQDISSVTQHSLRKNIGLVPQDSVLFNETARYNIAYGGGPDVTEEEVYNATRAAQMYDRIMSFPDKFETRVGERGQRLSGGEKQRVAIARVLLKNPPILLLDEATSALDTTNERAIQAHLRELSTGRTTLAIAHRLSTVVDCDCIYVLNEGVIAEQGSHSELLAMGGLYAELWQKQIEGEQSVPGTGAATPIEKVAEDDSE